MDKKFKNRIKMFPLFVKKKEIVALFIKAKLRKKPHEKRTSKFDVKKNQSIDQADWTRDELLKLYAGSRAEIQKLKRVNEGLRESVKKYEAFFQTVLPKLEVENEKRQSTMANLRESVDATNQSIASIKFRNDIERERFQSKIDDVRATIEAVNRSLANVELNENAIVRRSARRAGVAGALKRHKSASASI